MPIALIIAALVVAAAIRSRATQGFDEPILVEDGEEEARALRHEFVAWQYAFSSLARRVEATNAGLYVLGGAAAAAYFVADKRFAWLFIIPTVIAAFGVAIRKPKIHDGSAPDLLTQAREKGEGDEEARLLVAIGKLRSTFDEQRNIHENKEWLERFALGAFILIVVFIGVVALFHPAPPEPTVCTVVGEVV